MMNLVAGVGLRLRLMAALALRIYLRAAHATPDGAPGFACSPDGAPPFRTLQPATLRPTAYDSSILSFDQQGSTRYACLHRPRQAEEWRRDAARPRWPLLIYLHGSLTTPDSLYSFGRDLLDLHHTFNLSDDPNVRGFALLAPEGRRAQPWPADGPQTGAGFHWDEWHRNPADNLDALAIDHFVDQVVAGGQVDPRRIYVFGWSNGAYMAALYGNWRSERIAAIGQYAGADPWSREPCPLPPQYTRKTPLVLLRNLCDQLVPCAATSAWIATLTQLDWPFVAYSLDRSGRITTASECDSRCSKLIGLYEHCRWPQKPALEAMLRFMREHPLG